MGKIYFKCDKCGKLLGETKEDNGYSSHNNINQIQGYCCYKPSSYTSPTKQKDFNEQFGELRREGWR